MKAGSSYHLRLVCSENRSRSPSPIGGEIVRDETYRPLRANDVYQIIMSIMPTGSVGFDKQPPR